MSEDFDAVVKAIDCVHGVNRDMPEIPLLHPGKDIENLTRKSDAWFRFDTGAAGEIMPRSISVRICTPNRRIKTLHEIGHYLDTSGLSAMTFSSIHATELDDWRYAVLESRCYAELADLESGLSGSDRDRLANARQIEEIWARSYAQFVAVRSDDPALLLDIEQTRIARIGNLRLPLQWDDRDFAVIADSIDALFWRLGWIARI